MKFTPRDYQREAVQAVCKGLGKRSRVTAVMACGTGKTLVALWVAEKLQAKTIVVFMPSLMLIKQTIETWTEQTKWPNYSYMAICCDDKLLDDDIIEIDAKECCFDVCINAEQVNAFMSNNNGVKIVFCTYQSSNIIPKDIKFDLAIFDEAHKTAHKDMGSFRYALYDENISVGKRLFLTATPRHYQLKSRTTHLEYSMSNEEVYGPIIYRLDFSQAIKKGIICDYKVLITILDDDRVLEQCANKIMQDHGRSFSLQMSAHVIAIKQAIDKYPIKRTVAFHRTIKDTKEFTRTALHIKGIKCNILDINSHMSSEDRAHTMKSFEFSSKAIISNARCLSEGVDIPSIDLVAFLSPKKSKIDIIQAIGRVMRKAPGKEYGYILLPIFVTDKNKIEQILESSEYRYIMQIVNSLREYDTNLQQQISDRCHDKGEYDERIKNKIEFINADINSDELAQAIDVDILDRFNDSRNWDYGFEEIKEWHEKNGSWVISGTRNKYDPIRAWINWQRISYKNGTLLPERIKKLRSIGFVFDATEERYEQKFEVFKKIIEKHGLTKTIELHNKSIDNWFQHMKKKIAKNEKLPIIDKLLNYLKKYPDYQEYLEIGKVKYFMLVKNNIAFLEDYYAKNGHINIKYTENKKVAAWLARLNKGGWRNLKSTSRKRLTDIGFIYRHKEKTTQLEEWDRNYKLLQKYKEIQPDLIFHKDEKKWIKLNKWVIRQRDKHRKSRPFLPGRKEKLKALGLFKSSPRNKRNKK